MRVSEWLVLYALASEVLCSVPDLLDWAEEQGV